MRARLAAAEEKLAARAAAPAAPATAPVAPTPPPADGNQFPEFLAIKKENQKLRMQLEELRRSYHKTMEMNRQGGGRSKGGALGDGLPTIGGRR